MEASGKSEEDVLLQTQQTQKHRPIQVPAQDGLAARACSLPAEVLDGKKSKRRESAASARGVLDEARFTAGIVGFYEAVLKEPIPEKMLRLVEEIARRERES